MKPDRMDILNMANQLSTKELIWIKKGIELTLKIRKLLGEENEAK